MNFEFFFIMNLIYDFKIYGWNKEIYVSFHESMNLILCMKKN